MRFRTVQVDPAQMIQQGLVQSELQKVKDFQRPPARFRAGEVTECRRRVWYRVAGFLPAPDKPNLTRAAGNIYHDMARHLLRTFGTDLQGIEVDAETGRQDEGKVRRRTFEHKGYTFEGSCRADHGSGQEGVMVDGIRSVLEIKSMSTFKMYHLTKALREHGPAGVHARLREFHSSYLYQGVFTAMITDFDHVYLLPMNRDNAEIGIPTMGGFVGIHWEIEDADRVWVLDRLADIQAAIESGNPPPPDYIPGSKPCDWCPFFYRCHGAEQRAANGLVPAIKYPVPGMGT